MTQTELFPVTKHIPQWLADYFYKANAGQYLGKQDFYINVKPIILNNHAEFVGYDLQIIDKPCHSCDGTGIYKKYDYNGHVYDKEQCWRCDGTGIYVTKHMSLNRYLLNGRIYHTPAYQVRSEPHKNEIKGLITHEPVDSNEAFKAYLILLWKYNRNWFYYKMKAMLEDRYLKPIREQLQNFCQLVIRKENTNDELPF